MLNLHRGALKKLASGLLAEEILQHHLCNAHTYASTLKSDLTSIFRKNLFFSNFQKKFKENRCWSYLCIAIISGICIQKIKAFSKKKASHTENNFLQDTKPISSISSGEYQACYYNPIPLNIIKKMKGKSYKENCPIPITDLAYVQVRHYNMNGKICLGELVVNQRIATSVMEIFQDIFFAKFPIEKMHLIDEYGADDEQSMKDNNSSAFCFRYITNRPGKISTHSRGLAIDINPRQNPYVKGKNISPSNTGKYIDRSLYEPGMIHSQDMVVKAFEQRGFSWGGRGFLLGRIWGGLKDYQHFEISRTQATMNLYTRKLKNWWKEKISILD